jgi:hypothetical protein
MVPECCSVELCTPGSQRSQPNSRIIRASKPTCSLP